MQGLIKRPIYLDQLISFRHKQLIKVVTGVRRCGKSTLFDLYEDYLKSDGVDENEIIKINLEDPDWHYIKDYTELYKEVTKRLIPDRMNYIFLDEVQNVNEFQKAVDGLFIKKNCDVYITGANAYLLSGDLATLLSGRYVEISMLPLSFKEYTQALGGRGDLQIKYQNYVQNGSFPYTLMLNGKREIRQYMEGIYTSIILKDVASRYRLLDMDILDRLVRFMFDNVGNLYSATSISAALTSSGKKISPHTVEHYLKALADSFILYRAERYDIKGKQYLTTGQKYYICDTGLRYYLLGNKNVGAGHILENIVYLELKRRGYEVFVGKTGNLETDFYAIGERGEEYYQVSWRALDENGVTIKRELAPLEAIKDHNPKYLLTMDFLPPMSHNGIKQINVLEWLLM